ncbi:MAG: nuclease-related domain-containing protein, partial [Kosmotogaceae bacterium]
MWVLVFLVFMFITAIYVLKYIAFRRSGYRSTNKNGFFRTIFNRGNYGEFLTFRCLEKLKGDHKFLTNLYLQKKDGSTTEIDLIMIDETGIYVFESKNYSGWIFGDEKRKNWVQTLENRQKNYFYNPIWQNRGHINALKSVLGIKDDDFYKSYIVFSERCTLKKVDSSSPNVRILNRNKLFRIIKEEIDYSPSVFTQLQMDRIY